jgi:N-methylhydantoinase A
VPLRGNQIKDQEALERLIEDFHGVHQRVFGISEPGEMIEFVNWGVQATAKMPEVKIKEQPYGGEDPSYAFAAKRKAYFKGLGHSVLTPVYRGENLLSGARISGPAIIEEPITTLVLFPGSTATVSKWGNYLIDL